MTLLHIIKKKKDEKIIVTDELLDAVRTLNSDLNFLKRKSNKIKFLLGIVQNKGNEINRIRIVLNQLKEIEKKEEGSNTENRLLIIFIAFYC
jgi:SpoU rRNA methylase family enzyme